MYVDDLLRFSDGQVVTADGSSTDTVDLGAVNVDLGTGENLYLAIIVTAVSGGSPTLGIKLQKDKDNSGTFSDVSGVSLSVSAIGQSFLRLPVGVVDFRFLKAIYDVGGTTPSFTLDSFIATEIDFYKSYPSGYKVS